MFKDCEKACVYTVDGDYIAQARVVNADRENMGLIFDGDDIDRLKTETVIVFFDGEQGLVTCRCRLSASVRVKEGEKRKEHAMFMVPCQIDEQLGVEQRRRDLKVRTSFDMKIEFLDQEGDLVSVKGRAKDISAGGVGLESTEHLMDGQKFSFYFETATGSTRLNGEVLWCEDLSTKNSPLYHYGCRFNNMTIRQESIVRRFTFQEQLKRRKIQ